MADNADKKKLLIAVVLVVLAGVVLSWSFGLFEPNGGTNAGKEVIPAPTSAAEAAKAGVKPRANARMVEQPK